MKEALDQLSELKAGLEKDRDTLNGQIAEVERVIALMKARHETIELDRRRDKNEERSASIEPARLDTTRPLSIANATLTEAMAVDALTEAGAKGLTPQELREGIGLDQAEFKVLAAKLLGARTMSRTGQRGRGVRYILSNLLAKADLNGSGLHTS